MIIEWRACSPERIIIYKNDFPMTTILFRIRSPQQRRKEQKKIYMARTLRLINKSSLHSLNLPGIIIIIIILRRSRKKNRNRFSTFLLRLLFFLLRSFPIVLVLASKQSLRNLKRTETPQKTSYKFIPYEKHLQTFNCFLITRRTIVVQKFSCENVTFFLYHIGKMSKSVIIFMN